ncbi:Bladder cancer-related protein BC10 [Geosmithia morbida]|uniref:Bladder cancer-related protein BC10 n=1 Tax=Geosmithia morbida TaxID=1094350 RepID=A0A9P4YMY2_9HYPO|nr:Bladder cancer-related protein BC10 [Geosmithia morbida]KAF4119535.1 Bladder cancer-related protein BC10 [Geosmithia morbida]
MLSCRLRSPGPTKENIKIDTCARSWLPLLFIPTNASPAFILLFLVCTYFLNRPCVYCSLLLLILFFTSCNWSERCFFDFSALDWYAPRPLSPAAGTTSACTAAAAACAHPAWKASENYLSNSSDAAAAVPQEWTGLGIQWLRMLLGGREWTIQALDLKIQL